MRGLARYALPGVVGLCMLVALGYVLHGRPPVTQPASDAVLATGEVQQTPADSAAAVVTPTPVQAAATAVLTAALQPTAVPKAASAQRYTAGQTAELKGVRVTLHEARFLQGNQRFTPPAGMRFLVVTVTFENTTDQDVLLSTALQMELKDDRGQAYGIDFVATAAAGGKQPDGKVAPGDKLRGPVGYQIPEGASGLQWIYKELFGSGRVVFDINPE